MASGAISLHGNPSVSNAEQGPSVVMESPEELSRRVTECLTRAAGLVSQCPDDEELETVSDLMADIQRITVVSEAVAEKTKRAIHERTLPPPKAALTPSRMTALFSGLKSADFRCVSHIAKCADFGNRSSRAGTGVVDIHFYDQLQPFFEDVSNASHLVLLTLNVGTLYAAGVRGLELEENKSAFGFQVEGYFGLLVTTPGSAVMDKVLGPSKASSDRIPIVCGNSLSPTYSSMVEAAEAHFEVAGRDVTAVAAAEALAVAQQALKDLALAQKYVKAYEVVKSGFSAMSKPWAVISSAFIDFQIALAGPGTPQPAMNLWLIPNEAVLGKYLNAMTRPKALAHALESHENLILLDVFVREVSKLELTKATSTQLEALKKISRDAALSLETTVEPEAALPDAEPGQDE